MTVAEFRSRLAELGMSQRGFAAFCGSNERSARRWALGEDILPWVPVMLQLMAVAQAAKRPGDAPGVA